MDWIAATMTVKSSNKLRGIMGRAHRIKRPSVQSSFRDCAQRKELCGVNLWRLPSWWRYKMAHGFSPFCDYAVSSNFAAAIAAVNSLFAA
jgi:hypothetical protein